VISSTIFSGLGKPVGGGFKKAKGRTKGGGGIISQNGKLAGTDPNPDPQGLLKKKGQKRRGVVSGNQPHTRACPVRTGNGVSGGWGGRSTKSERRTKGGSSPGQPLKAATRPINSPCYASGFPLGDEQRRGERGEKPQCHERFFDLQFSVPEELGEPKNTEEPPGQRVCQNRSQATNPRKQAEGGKSTRTSTTSIERGKVDRGPRKEGKNGVDPRTQGRVGKIGE